MMRRFLGWVPFALADDAVKVPDGLDTEIDVLQLVPMHQAHGAGDFHFDEQAADQMIANHLRDAARGYFPPMAIDHPVSGKPATGYLVGLKKVGTRLRATVRVLSHFVESIRRGEWRGLSPEIVDEYVDETKQKRGAKITGLAVTNHQFQKGHADGGPALAFALTEITDEGNHEDQDMTEAEVKALVAEATGPLTTQLADQAKQLTTLSETQTKLVAAEGEIKKLTESNTQLGKDLAETRAANDARDIRDVVGKALAAGKLVPAQVKLGEVGPSDAAWEANKWLSESPFRDLAALRKHVMTAPPVVDFAGRQSFAGTPPDSQDAIALKALSERTGVSEASLRKAGELIDRAAS